MKFQKYLSNHYAKYLSKAKDDLLEKLLKLDNKLFKKKSKFLKVKDFRKRTIWTPYSDLLSFSRRRYYDIKNKKYRYLLDDHLGIDKYKFISKHYQKLAIFNFQYFKSYKDIAKIIFNERISKMSIHNFIKDYRVKFSMDNYICNNDGILWINADGMWIKKNKTTKAIEIKNFVLFSGRKLDPFTKKWKIEGKTLVNSNQTSIKLIANKLERIILEYQGVREIRLIGDGARWIKSLAKELGAIYYIDKFHYSKSINNLIGIRSKRKYLIYELINKEYPKNIFRNKLLKIVANSQTGEITKMQLREIEYLVSNYHYYIRNYKYDNPINCIEAIQSHYQAKYFKNQRKGWSNKILNKLIPFIFSKVNGGSSLEIDIGKDINYPLHNNYGINASIPGIENPYMARLLNKNWK